MNTKQKSEYAKLRRAGWLAESAARAARTLVSFKRREAPDDDGEPHDPRTECVRLRIVPDDFANLDDLCGDMFEPRHHPEIPPAKLARERADYLRKIEREGVIGIIAEYWSETEREWLEADSCYGFLGSDAHDLAATADLMRSALDARTHSVRVYRKMCHAAP